MKEALTALALMTPADLPEGGLDALRWEARPILIFAEGAAALAEAQLARLRENAADLAARRNVVVVDRGGPAGAPLRARFRPEGFAVILVGLDGGEKFRAGAVVDPDRLDALIDAMPMRRRELREGGAG